MVDALRRIHAALVPGGLLVDTQPLVDRAPLLAGGAELGALDVREFRETIVAGDALLADSGLFEPVRETWFDASERFRNGPDCLATVTTWEGTRVPPELAERLRALDEPVDVAWHVRLRLLRAR